MNVNFDTRNRSHPALILWRFCVLRHNRTLFASERPLNDPMTFSQLYAEEKSLVSRNQYCPTKITRLLKEHFENSLAEMVRVGSDLW